MKKLLSKIGSKTKSLTSLAVLAGASLANAAVTFDRTSGELKGNVEMGAYYSGVEILIGVLAITITVSLAISMLMRAKRG